jgi:hypothetical protein
MAMKLKNILDEVSKNKNPDKSTFFYKAFIGGLFLQNPIQH